MKFTAILPKHYTADAYEVERDTNGAITNLTLLGILSFSLDTTEGSSLNIDSEDVIPSGVLLRNIRDRNSELVYPNEGDTGADYVVFYSQPLLSPFGTREGFTSKARRLT